MTDFMHDLMLKAGRAQTYFRVRGAAMERGEHIPSSVAFAWARGDGEGLSLKEFICERTHGHRWAYTGTAYGGDDERYMGEGRCYCANCGADGDA